MRVAGSALPVRGRLRDLHADGLGLLVALTQRAVVRTRELRLESLDLLGVDALALLELARALCGSTLSLLLQRGFHLAEPPLEVGCARKDLVVDGPRHATFGTLLMSTGLTFGTISSLYGLNAGIIDNTQFSLLVTVVVLSAIVPTAIAQRWFAPDANAERERDLMKAARKARIPAEEYV
jgi:hypothetical protein